MRTHIYICIYVYIYLYIYIYIYIHIYRCYCTTQESQNILYMCLYIYIRIHIYIYIYILVCKYVCTNINIHKCIQGLPHNTRGKTLEYSSWYVSISLYIDLNLFHIRRSLSIYIRLFPAPVRAFKLVSTSKNLQKRPTYTKCDPQGRIIYV